MAVTEYRKTGIYKVTFTWTSSSAGAVSEATTYSYNGQLVRAIFDPDAAGTQPTAAYDVVVNDDDGYDLLHGLGADLSNSANVYKDEYDGMGYCVSSKMTLAVTNAGDTKGGVVVLYLRPLDRVA